MKTKNAPRMTIRFPPNIYEYLKKRWRREDDFVVNTFVVEAVTEKLDREDMQNERGRG